jgi:assimilatory nitrate reductase catalytic subunit
LAQTVFITGSNMAWAHPVLFRRLEDARRANAAQRWIVADPRRTETAEAADLHLQLLPGTDVVLHHSLLHVMLWEGLTDTAFIRDHTQGFEALRDRVREFTPAHAAKVCGLRADDIVQAARWFAGLDGQRDAQSSAGVASGSAAGQARTPSLSLYCQGLNQSSSGTDKNTTLINLHLATGQIGRPGAGPFSLTGQPNAMGGREVGGLSNLLSAHRDLDNPAHRAEVAALWGIADVPSRPGKSAVEMFQAAADGEIKALWIVCTNPAQSMPDQATIRRALQRAEFVVLQEAYAHTATADFADLVLPAASWGEKEGTVTNSERRISRVRAAVPPPGEAREDWRIAVDVAQRLGALLAAVDAKAGHFGAGVGEIADEPPAEAPVAGRSMGFAWATPEAVWNEHRESTRGRDLDITGLSYAGLAAPQQWPCPEGQARGQARLYTDARFATPDGRARFLAPAWRGPADPRDARFPVALTTGRLRDQWHGMSRTGTLGRLFAHASEPCVEMHPQELARRRWSAGTLVRVKSRRGELVLPAVPNTAVLPAQAFIAMHWGSEFMAGTGVNALTTGAHCAQSKQPELKHAAARIELADLPHALVAAAWLPAAEALALRERLRNVFPQLAYAVCLPFGREPDQRLGVLFRGASAQPDAALTADLAALFGLVGQEGGACLRYEDARRGHFRAMRLSTDGSLQAFVLAGDATAQAWVLDLLQQGQAAAAFGRALLAASPMPPLALAPRSPQVCACLDVSEARIVLALREFQGPADDALAALQSRLRCGTECGSCLPAVRSLVRRHAGLATLP